MDPETAALGQAWLDALGIPPDAQYGRVLIRRRDEHHIRWAAATWRAGTPHALSRGDAELGRSWPERLRDHHVLLIGTVEPLPPGDLGEGDAPWWHLDTAGTPAAPGSPASPIRCVARWHPVLGLSINLEGLATVGHTRADIGRAWRSRALLGLVAHHAGRPPLTEADIRATAERYREHKRHSPHLTAEQIAARLNLSYEQLRYRLRRAGVAE